MSDESKFLLALVALIFAACIVFVGMDMIAKDRREQRQEECRAR